jgi:starch synthase
MIEDTNIRAIMFAVEAFPFTKVGGLADVVGAMPKELAKLGIRVSVVLPAFEESGRTAAEYLEFDVAMGTRRVHAQIRRTTLPESSVEVFFIAGGGYFPRPGLYDDPRTGEGYSDNLERFAFFARAGLELMRKIGDPVDVVHCHDAQTALIPAFLRLTLRQDPFFAHSGTLFTIHNAAYQSLFDKEDLLRAGIDPGLFSPMSPLEFWGKVNLLKAGIETADVLNTVSPTYAREIQSNAEYGCGLEGAFKNRSDVLFGVLNGIDERIWNPQTDPLIPARFTPESLAGKRVCKSWLLNKTGLPEIPNRIPLMGIVSRLVDQKGLDLVVEALEELMALDLQIVILGTGMAKYHELLSAAAARYPHKISVRLCFDDKLAHEIEAGCDLFLMPSRYEPCGLNQLYSMRYGTIPIVRATGGLADTVSDYDAEAQTGTGFVFADYSTAAMMKAVRRALAVFGASERWRGLIARAMAGRWSWEDSAVHYLELYERICRIRRPNPGL